MVEYRHQKVALRSKRRSLECYSIRRCSHKSTPRPVAKHDIAAADKRLSRSGRDHPSLCVPLQTSLDIALDWNPDKPEDQ